MTKETSLSLDAPPVEAKKAKKTYGKRTKEDNKENEAEEKKSTSSKSASPQDFTVPMVSSTPQELVILILLMQLNACRCWIGLETSCERIVDLARSENGPNGWLPVLAVSDLAGARKRADHFFRLMFKAATQFTQGLLFLLFSFFFFFLSFSICVENLQSSVRPSVGFSSLDLKQVGLHFFTKSEASSLSTLCEHILRCGVQFEKSEEAAGQPAFDRLISFYERSFQLMEQLYEISFCTKHQSCCEHYGYILRKVTFFLLLRFALFAFFPSFLLSSFLFFSFLLCFALQLVMEICQAGSVMDVYKALGRGLKEEHISFITHESLKVSFPFVLFSSLPLHSLLFLFILFSSLFLSIFFR